MTVQDLDERRHRSETESPLQPQRWQPVRAGVLNVWRYYDEVFEFHQGRLLIRGPNGSGKSKVLEVLLPFLFDASLRANRLSTFGTADRTMHWNMMGEGAGGGVTRVGYVWLELCLGTQGGHKEWFTCGARLSASTRTSSVNSDWFTTSQRVGDDLNLLTESGQPLTKAALETALSGQGELHPNAGEYRRAIRSKLFPGMNESRYDALIMALLQLRTPKLSQRLDPGLLSDLLSRALPPLDEGDIAELAEGFERLDRQREELNRLHGIVEAAKTVARQAQTYSRRVLRSAAAGLISATTGLENASLAARESQQRFEQVHTELEEAELRHEALGEQVSACQERIDGLTSSDVYREGRELDDLRRQRRSAQVRADGLQGQIEDVRGRLERLREQTQRHEGALRSATGELTQNRTLLIRAAERVELGARTPAEGLDVDAEAARRLINVSVTARRQEMAEVRAALHIHSAAVARREDAEAAKEAAVTARQEARGAFEQAEAAVEVALDGLAERLARWAQECTLLEVDGERLAASASDEDEVRELVSQAQNLVLGRISAERSDLQHRREQVGREHEQTRLDLAALTGEVHLTPQAPYTRTADRHSRSGAPLWQLVTFRPDVPAENHAGIEAALEASGLLDAWITPDGRPLTIDGHDVFASHGRRSVEGPSLADVLMVENDPVVNPSVIAGLLSTIAYGLALPTGSEAAVAADGSWRMSSLQGTWSKVDAAYIGATARERARQQRIRELTEQLDVLADQIEQIDAALEQVHERERGLAAEVAARPGYQSVRQAKQQMYRTQAALTVIETALGRAQGQLAAAEVSAGQALRSLMNVAAERRLPSDEASLNDLDQALEALTSAADAWAGAHRQTRSAADAVELFSGQCADLERDAARTQEEAATAQAEAQALTNRLQAVEEAIGSTYEQILAEVEAARQQLGRAEQEQRRLTSVLRQLSESQGELRHARLRDADLHREALAVRDSAADAMHALLGGYLVQDAGLELDLGERDGSRAALDAARAIAAAWPTVPFEQRHITMAQTKLMETLHEQQDALARRADLEMLTEDEVAVLSVSIGGLRMSAATLLERLRTELDGSRDDITGAEHQLFDRTLTGDTRRHLAARIRQARQLVDAMNERLAMVRTASSVAVRLTWQIDPQLPATTKTARELLLKDPVRLSEEDRHALHTFFRERIEEARAANTAASWQEQLAQVFDYTAWHQFQVNVERGKGLGWEKLTSKLHGALSGGEKAIALHLPLFAAIAAHYQAVPLSPRLILLDEVFVGVDTVNRGQVFALLTALDLDLMLTSDHEWGTYRELGGIAVHQLETGSGQDQDDAVTSVRFIWDGADLRPAAND